MRYTNEKWLDKQAELIIHKIKSSRNEEENKYWIKRGLKDAYTEGAHKEIVLKALENHNK